MCVDCYRIMWGIQQKGSLKQLFQNSSDLFPCKQPILWHTAILFLHKKAFTERGVLFLMTLSDCASIAAELCEIFKKRVLLNIYYRIPSPFSMMTATILLLDNKEKKWERWPNLSFCDFGLFSYKMLFFLVVSAFFW